MLTSSKYESSKMKFLVRQEMVKLYRKFSFLKSIPSDRGYWTLCNLQSENDKSEISQMINTGLITKSQFYGIDNNKKIIQINKKTHPEANWLYGNWIDVIKSNHSIFNPSLIYYDSTHTVSLEDGLIQIAETMNITTENVFIAINVMMENPRARKTKFDEDYILKNIKDMLVHKGRWNVCPFREDYKSFNTKMSTFFFYDFKER